MKTGGNLLDFGEALDKTMSEIIQELPVGVRVEQVSDQPEVVEEAVGGFTKALFEAVAIVLAISFVSLGMRAGPGGGDRDPAGAGHHLHGHALFGISLQRSRSAR